MYSDDSIIIFDAFYDNTLIGAQCFLTPISSTAAGNQFRFSYGDGECSLSVKKYMEFEFSTGAYFCGPFVSPGCLFFSWLLEEKVGVKTKEKSKGQRTDQAVSKKHPFLLTKAGRFTCAERGLLHQREANHLNATQVSSNPRKTIGRGFLTVSRSGGQRLESTSGPR